MATEDGVVGVSADGKDDIDGGAVVGGNADEDGVGGDGICGLGCTLVSPGIGQTTLRGGGTGGIAEGDVA